MIKPEFWQSKTLRKCSLEARLLFIGLWNFCDDYGVCLNSNRKILGEIFPFDENISEKRLEKWKNELIENKLVIPVEYDSTKYLIIRSWFEHQIVPNPSKRRYLDEDIQDKLMKDYLETNETLNISQLSKEKEKEKEKEKIEITHPLQILVSKLQFVSKLDKQLTIQECERLYKEFDPILLEEVLHDMDNYKPLLKKYKSVNLTLRKWIKIREDRNGKQQRGYIPNKFNNRKGDIDFDKYKKEFATERKTEEET